jgi:ectoine hydroxylase-related dioxygenase (phytanoyl-CoA dioxygenase family)
MFTFTADDLWQVAPMSIEEFLVGMSALGTPQEIQMVGTFGEKADAVVRTAHRDVDLPMHRDGIFTQAIADMQNGTYVEKPNVDIVGLYCVRDDEPCFTTLSHDGQTVFQEVNLRAGDALIWNNKLWHGRRGPVGKRLLIRFWTSLPK